MDEAAQEKNYRLEIMELILQSQLCNMEESGC